MARSLASWGQAATKADVTEQQLMETKYERSTGTYALSWHRYVDHGYLARSDRRSTLVQ